MMKWSAYQAFFSGRIFVLPFSHACRSYSEEKKKKKEIDKWGGGRISFWYQHQHSYDHDHDAFNITCGPHFTSPHLTLPHLCLRGAGIGGESDAKPLDDGRYTGTGA